jgi:hypothetical protein
LSDLLAVSDNLELTALPGRKDGFNVEALLDEGHETRDLGLVVLSCRAVHDLDLHLSSKALLKFYALTRVLRRFIVSFPFQNREVGRTTEFGVGRGMKLGGGEVPLCGSRRRFLL